MRIPAFRDPDDSFAYESPRSPDISEAPDRSRRPMANIVPNTLRKDGKNPLTCLCSTAAGKQTRTSSLDHSALQLARENDELALQLRSLEDRARKLRRGRILYVERERQARELQEKLSRILGEIEDIREANPDLELGLSELLRDLDDDHDDAIPPAASVSVASLYANHSPIKVWHDQIPNITREMRRIREKFIEVVGNLS